MLPGKPTVKIVNNFLSEWVTLESYILQENSLKLLFNKLCPSNKSIEDILLKVSALNDFYSTFIFDTYSASKHILNCDIDEEIETENIEIVNRIARVAIKNKTINFYSFASKYCSHHKPEIYPIYDSYVVKMLMYFKKKDNFYKFRKVDLLQYSIFLQAIHAFQKFYDLGKFTLREIDIYLWLAGKKYFPNKY